MQSTERLLSQQFYVLTYRNTKKYYIESNKENASLRCYIFLEKADALRYSKWVNKVADIDTAPAVSESDKTLEIVLKVSHTALKDVPDKHVEVLVVESLEETESGFLMPVTRIFHNSTESTRN